MSVEILKVSKLFYFILPSVALEISNTVLDNQQRNMPGEQWDKILCVTKICVFKRDKG